MNPNSILSTPPRFIVYKTTNNKNNMIYVGVHACKCEECKYVGSGRRITKAIRELGIDSFSKEILFECLTKEEMMAKEKEIVNDEFIKREDTYNVILGGGDLTTLGCKLTEEHKKKIGAAGKGRKLSEATKDRQRKSKLGEKNPMFGKSNYIVWEEKYGAEEASRLSKERGEKASEKLKGSVVVRDSNNNRFRVPLDDPRYLSGELVVLSRGSVASDETKKKQSKKKKGTLVVKDAEGKTFQVALNDPRYISGELVALSKGRKHSEATKLLLKELAAKRKANQ